MEEIDTDVDYFWSVDDGFEGDSELELDIESDSGLWATLLYCILHLALIVMTKL